MLIDLSIRGRAVIGGIRLVVGVGAIDEVLLGDLQGGNGLLTCPRGTVASKDNIAQSSAADEKRTGVLEEIKWQVL
jgi:hypothetical protein